MTLMMRFAVRLCLVVACSGLVLQANDERKLVPDDLFRMEELDGVAISSDGQSSAFVVKRPMKTATSFGRPYLWGSDRADVWIANLGDRTGRNITNGAKDGSGFWSPIWSPDGQALAMLATRGGAIRLWVWRRSDGSLRPVSESGVTANPDSFLWVSNHELLFWTLPQGETEIAFRIDRQTPEAVIQESSRTWRGETAAASVLESGTKISSREQLISSLSLADLATGTTRRIAGSTGYGQFAFDTLTLAPDRHAVAFLQQVGILRPDPAQPEWDLRNSLFELSVVDLDRESNVQQFVGTRGAYSGSVVWSPNSKELAIIAKAEGNSLPPQVLRCALITSTCRPVATNSMQLPLNARNVVRKAPYMWLSDERLLIEGELAEGKRSEIGNGSRWWIAESDGTIRPWVLRTSGSDQALEPGGRLDRHEFLAIVDGSIWRVDEQGVPKKRVAPSLQGQVLAISTSFAGVLDENTKFVAHTEDGSLYVVDASSGQVSPLPKPSAEAQLAVFDAQGRVFLFREDKASGTCLWRSMRDQDGFVTLLATNQFLKDMKPGELKKIKYRGDNGQTLAGWLIVPPGAAAERLPVVVWVYPGTIFGDRQPAMPHMTFNNPHPLNLQLLAAHGYLVLLPSMPSPPYGTTVDGFLELTTGVMPAIQKIIDMGIADPDRIAVMGQSAGGYAVLGLIAQSHVFKAAIELAGPADLVSLYGTFDARMRYQDAVHEDLFRMWGSETSGMGSPPWMDLQRYIRNSPLAYAERIETPLLIIQGDLDYVPIQQGEEMFTALYRQNKRAEFIRYWGEDHLLSSPANIRDMWNRIYAWLDAFTERR